MPMGLEGSISSWIGKIREEFDTFCSDTKEILHQKQVENVQEQFIAAGESLKQMLNVFSSFKLDEMEECMDLHYSVNESTYEKDVAKSDEIEEKIDLHIGIDDQKDIISEENKSADEKDVTKCDEIEEKIELLKLKLATGIDDQRDMIAEPTPKNMEDNVRISMYDISDDQESSLSISPNLPELVLALEELEYLHAQSMVSFKCSLGSRNDTDKSGSVSDSKFWTWTQDYSLTEEEPHSDEIQNSDYSHLLGQELHAELIKQGFLSPRSGSDCTWSFHKHFMQPIDFGSIDADVALNYNSALQSRLLDFSFLDFDTVSASIPDMSEYRNSSKQSPICDFVVTAELNQENTKIVQDNDWVKLDEDFSDGDSEIV